MDSQFQNQKQENSAEEEKKPTEKKKRIKKEKPTQGSQTNGTRQKQNQQISTQNQSVALRKNQQLKSSQNEMFTKCLSNLQIHDQLRLFFMRELRQTVPIIKEILPSHKFLLFGEVPLDLDFFIHKMKIRKLDSNSSIFDQFRSIQRYIKYKNRIEFDLNSSYQGLNEFQYIIEALRSMSNQIAFQFAQTLQDYQNNVRQILARNDYYKKCLQNQNVDVNLEERIQQSLQMANQILDSIDPENEIFIYNIISKQFNGLVTLKKGYSKGLIKNLGVSDEEFIRSVQENKLFQNLVDQVNHASIIHSQSKMEENPYLKLKSMEVVKNIHPEFHHHHHAQMFQNILRKLVKEAVSKQDIIEQFLQTNQDEMIDDENPNYIPNPLPTFQQYQKFNKNIILHPPRHPPHKYFELFQNITQILTKKQFPQQKDFQQSQEKIISQSSQMLTESEINQKNYIQNDDITRRQSNDSQQFSTATISYENKTEQNQQSIQNSVNPSIFENSKEYYDQKNFQIFNENLSKKQSNNYDQNSIQFNLNQSLFNDAIGNGYNISNDNEIMLEENNQLPFNRSVSLQQIANPQNGVSTNLFNEFNPQYNDKFYFEEEGYSSSLFNDQYSFFKTIEENQSSQIDKNQFEQKENNIQVEQNNLAQSMHLFQNTQQNFQKKQNDLQIQEVEQEEEKQSNTMDKQMSLESCSQEYSNKPDQDSQSSNRNLKQKIHFGQHHKNHNFKHMGFPPPFNFHHPFHFKPESHQQDSNDKKNENKNVINIKNLCEQFLEYIGEDEEKNDRFPFNDEFIGEYEQIRSLLEDGKYMQCEEFNKFIDDIKSQPKFKGFKFERHKMKMHDFHKHEKRKKEEKYIRRQNEKNPQNGDFNSNQNPILSQSQSISSSSSSQSPHNIRNHRQFSNQNDNQNQKQDAQQVQQSTDNNFNQNQQSSFNNIFNFSSNRQNGQNMYYSDLDPNQKNQSQEFQINTPNFPDKTNQIKSNFNGSNPQVQSNKSSSQWQNEQEINQQSIQFNKHIKHSNFNKKPQFENMYENPNPTPSINNKLKNECFDKNQNDNNQPFPPQNHHPSNHPHNRPPPYNPTHQQIHNSGDHFPKSPHSDPPHHHHPKPSHPMEFLKQIREHFEGIPIADKSELINKIKNNLQEAILQGQLNNKIGDFLKQDNNFEKATEVVYSIITDKEAFKQFENDNHLFFHHRPFGPSHHGPFGPPHHGPGRFPNHGPHQSHQKNSSNAPPNYNSDGSPNNSNNEPSNNSLNEKHDYQNHDHKGPPSHGHRGPPNHNRYEHPNHGHHEPPNCDQNGKHESPNNSQNGPNRGHHGPPNRGHHGPQNRGHNGPPNRGHNGPPNHGHLEHPNRGKPENEQGQNVPNHGHHGPPNHDQHDSQNHGHNEPPNHGHNGPPNHHHRHHPHHKQKEVIKKIYELNTNLLSLDCEIQINDYLEVFYIGKTKQWRNFSKDFILNNSFRDIDHEINSLKQNQIIQKYYSNQINNLKTTKESQFDQQNNIFGSQFEQNSSSDSPRLKSISEQNRTQSETQKIEWQSQKINKEQLQKIINQFKMGPPHPFKTLLLLKKAIQKIIKHIPETYLNQNFLKNALKMIVYLLQGDIENFVLCRQRIPLEIVDNLEKNVLKKFSNDPIL